MVFPLVGARRLAWLLLPALALAAGCGGGGGSTPPAAGTTTLRGQVQLPSGQSAADMLVKVEGTALQVRPNADGSFVIANVPPGVQTVSAFSPATNVGAHVAVTVPNGGTVIVPPMQVGAGGQIAGIVTVVGADGSLQAKAGAAIVAVSGGPIMMAQDGVNIAAPTSGGGAQPAATTDVRLTATSGDDGSFVIKAVPAGGYQVTASLSGYDDQQRFVFVSVASTAAADFTFGQPPQPAMGTVKGVVSTKNANGQLVPVAGVQVYGDAVYPMMGAAGAGGAGTAVPAGKARTRSRQDASGAPAVPSIYPVPPIWQGSYATTDENGAYTLTLLAGHHTIQAQSRDYQDASAEVDVVGNQTVTLNFTLEPVPGGRPQVTLAATTDKASYALGDPVRMGLTLANTGTLPVQLTFDGSEAGFAVFGSGQIIWSYGQYWLPVPMPMVAAGTATTTKKRDVLNAVLEPGQTREYHVVWSQRGYMGDVVAPGTYTLRGMVQTDTIQVQSDAVEFAVTR